MPTLLTIDIDSLEKPCLGNATQQVGCWRGGGTALLHLVLEEELGSVAGHSQTRSVVEWIEPAWSRQASALNFRWMTCFPLPSHDVVDEPQLSVNLSVYVSVLGREKKKKKKQSEPGRVLLLSVLVCLPLACTHLHDITRTKGTE